MSLFTLTKVQSPDFDSHGELPKHIAIIMDGNRRWAKQKGLPILEGHRRGVLALKRTAQALSELGIHYLTVFAFSTENSSRSFDEVNGLMKLIQITLKRELVEMHEKGIRLRIIGNRQGLPEDVRNMVEYAEQLTTGNTSFFLTIALNYGSQQDITLAVRILAEKVKTGEINPEEITPQMLTQNLSTANLPIPDLLVRSSGENRLSNFLLWELSYAEFIFEKTYWPDFNKDTIKSILFEFQNRQRRYGR